MLPNPPRAPHDQRSSPVEWDAHKHKPHWCGGRRRARRTWPQCPRAAGLAQTNFARNFLRSLFETTQKRCNSNDMNSRFELLAGELRATLLIDSHDEGAGGHRFHHVACYRWGRPHRRPGRQRHRRLPRRCLRLSSRRCLGLSLDQHACPLSTRVAHVGAGSMRWQCRPRGSVLLRELRVCPDGLDVDRVLGAFAC